MSTHIYHSSGALQNNSGIAACDDAALAVKGLDEDETLKNIHRRLMPKKSLVSMAELQTGVTIDTDVIATIGAHNQIILKDREGEIISGSHVELIKKKKKKKLLFLLHSFNHALNKSLYPALNCYSMTPSPADELTQEHFLGYFKEIPPKEPEYLKIRWHDIVLFWQGLLKYRRNAVLLEKFRGLNETWHYKHDVRMTYYSKLWHQRFNTRDNKELFLQEWLNQLIDDTGSTVEVTLDAQATAASVDAYFSAFNAFPDEEYNVCEKEFTIQETKLSKAKKHQYYMDQLHSIGFRLIGETFRALTDINHIIFSGFARQEHSGEKALNPVCLYSVELNKEQWQGINFDLLPQLSPVEVISGFTIRRKVSENVK